MNGIRLLGILIFSMGFLVPCEIRAQDLGRSGKKFSRALAGFNRAFEENNPDLLKSPVYRRRLNALRKTCIAYHREAFSPEDSLAYANNRAVLHALSGEYTKALQLTSPFLSEETDTKVKYHHALFRLLRKDYAGASADLSACGDYGSASLNRIVALGSSGAVEAALGEAVGGEDADPDGKRAYNQGVILRKTGDTERAFQSLSDAIRRHDAPAYRLQRGSISLALGNYQTAFQDFGKAAEFHPQALVRQAYALLALEEFAEARKLLEGYLKRRDRKGRAEVYLALGHANYGLLDYKDARRFYDLAASHRPTATDARCGLANVALSEHRYATARKIFDYILAEDSTCTQAYLGRAVALYGLRAYETSLEDFERAAALIDVSRESMADVFVSRGYAYYFTGQTGKARNDFETAVRLDAGRYEALAGLASICIAAKKYPEAGKYLSAALNYERSNDKMWSNYGNLLLHFGMYGKGHAVFKTAVTLNPKNLNAQNGWGITLLENDRLEKAKMLFDSLVRTNPSNAVLLNNRGIVHAYLGNRFGQYQQSKQADRHYELAGADFNLAMQTAPARRFYQVNKGNVFWYWRQFEDARTSYQSYQDKSALNNTAVMFAGLERMKDARYYMGVALQLDSAHRVFQYNMDVLKNGKAREMAKLVASAKDNGPYSDIGIKYSLDGYVTIYLYDYEYDTLRFPGRHHLPAPVRTFSEDNLMIPVYDFTLMPYTDRKDSPGISKKTAKPFKARVKNRASGRTPSGRGRSGTKCPVLI